MVRKKKKGKYSVAKEVHVYCRNNMEVLVKLVLKFHELAFVHTKAEFLFDKEITTLSSMALKIFLSITDINDKLGIEPLSGCNKGKSGKCQSKIAMIWMNNIRNKSCQPEKFQWIYHRLGEKKKFGQYYVDGYDEDTDTAYEFNGCYFHRCLKCLKKKTF